MIPPSSDEYPILGLNLVRLLAENRIAEFHTELELLPLKALDHPCIKYAVELEKSFMEGTYNQLFNARQAVPHETYVCFMDLLAETIRWVNLHRRFFLCGFCREVPYCVFYMLFFRDEIADCSGQAYDYLSVSDAKKMLMFTSDQELLEYISEVSNCSFYLLYFVLYSFFHMSDATVNNWYLNDLRIIDTPC